MLKYLIFNLANLPAGKAEKIQYNYHDITKSNWYIFYIYKKINYARIKIRY